LGDKVVRFFFVFGVEGVFFFPPVSPSPRPSEHEPRFLRVFLPASPPYFFPGSVTPSYHCLRRMLDFLVFQNFNGFVPAWTFFCVFLVTRSSGNCYSFNRLRWLSSQTPAPSPPCFLTNVLSPLLFVSSQLGQFFSFFRPFSLDRCERPLFSYLVPTAPPQMGLFLVPPL